MKPNPFPGAWPKFGDHIQDGECKVLNGDDFLPSPNRPKVFPLSNRPKLPPEEEVVGRVVLIAGKAKASGKSVLSHEFMHELSGDKRTPIDLVDEDEPNLVRDDAKTSFARIVDCAKFEGLIDPEGVARILANDRWVLQSRQFFRELDGNCLVIRLGRPDATISTKKVAADIVEYARLARRLKHSIYLYEYGYDELNKWQELVQQLNDDMDRVVPIKAPLLLVVDAMRFIQERLDGHPGCLPLDRAGVKRFFESQATQDREMKISLGALSNIMHLAYEESNARNERRVSSQRVIDHYYRYWAMHFWRERGDVP